jgi:RNA polymerase sigma-70 factor (ECF subfamily)
MAANSPGEQSPPAGVVDLTERDLETACSETAADAELVGAVRLGRREAFDVLVRRHQRAVYRVCFRFARGHEDASDLTQEVFLRAFRGLASYRGQAAFKTWLYRIAINVGLSRAGRPQPPALELEPWHATADASPELHEAIDRSRRAGRVRAAVAELPPKQRAAVVLRVFQELSHEEAARVLGCTVGTVKANVFHALRKLRARLGEP